MTLQFLSFEPLDDSIRLEYQQDWREVYSRSVNEKISEWTYLDFDWHTFTWGETPHLEMDSAWNAYRSKDPTNLILLDNIDGGLAYKCNGPNLPDFSKKGLDVYICTPDMKWTMVFTHEDDFVGSPFFCTRKMANP